MRRGRGRGAADREREPSAVGDVARRLVGDRGWDENLALGRLKANWASVVGEQIAARSEPVRLERGRLTIRVEGGAWAAELALLGSSLATASAGFLGADLVAEVAVVTGPIHRP